MSSETSWVLAVPGAVPAIVGYVLAVLLSLVLWGLIAVRVWAIWKNRGAAEQKQGDSREQLYRFRMAGREGVLGGQVGVVFFRVVNVNRWVGSGLEKDFDAKMLSVLRRLTELPKGLPELEAVLHKELAPVLLEGGVRVLRVCLRAEDLREVAAPPVPEKADFWRKRIWL